MILEDFRKHFLLIFKVGRLSKNPFHPSVGMLHYSVVSPSWQSREILPTRLFCPWDFPGTNTGGGCHPPPGGLPNPGIEPMSPALLVDSYHCAT